MPHVVRRATRKAAAAASVSALLALAFCTAFIAVATPAPAQDNAFEAKIDPPLRDALRDGKSARVILLGRTQLFAPLGGLEKFEATHANDDRRVLRKEVVATLKRNAATEQPRILKALGRDHADQSLWILNALSLELSAAEIRAASKLEDVLFIYAGGEKLPAAPSRRVSPIVLAPAAAPPAFSAAGKRIAWNVQHLNAPRVWSELNNLGNGAVVAVLDNGANYLHSDLRSHVWRNAREIPNNGIDDDRNGYVDDVYGYDFGSQSPDVHDTTTVRERQHGTMTSGMVLGDGTGGIITGVAPRARLMLLKITSGNVDEGGNRPIGAAIAYQYAIENGADILSMSFSLPDLGNLRGFWRMMSDHAVASGLVLVGGAGNFRTTQPIPVQHQTPKDIPSVISVGGIDTLGVLRPFSSMGPAEWSSVALYGDYPMPKGIVKPDLVAFPGEGYPVLGIANTGYINTDSVRIRGNSFSGPQVAGIAALIFSERPAMSVWRMREILERSAHDLGEPGKDNMFGYGLVDAYAAVRMARDGGITSKPATTSGELLDSTALDGFRWRNVGPAEMGGRVTDIEGLPSPSHTFYVAMATGGIWKTTNAGTTFAPIFDNERVISMGDIAIAPSDTNQIWAGTGEQNVRNSVSPGGGVYKSINGGASWKLMGLERTQQIGRIVVHPRNPNTVFVAALGHVWEANSDRGLYKTIDGGRTWRLVKFIDDSTGFVDVIIDPRAPNVMFAASWQVRRSAYDFASGGKGSALWKSIDGGETWREVRGGGFPSTTKGRIGLAIAPSDSRVVYASVEADSVRSNGRSGTAPSGGLLSGLYRSVDGGVTWTRTSDINSRPFYFSQVTVDTRDAKRVYWSSTPVQYSTDGGVTARIGSHGVHPDHHAMWIDPADPQHQIVGNDGGVAQSFDRGGSYTFLNVMPVAQFNGISYNMALPYRLCGGLQDNGTWCGPSRSKTYPLVGSEWTHIVGGDGFNTAQHPTDVGTVYGESQVGVIQRVDPNTGVGGRLQRPRVPAGGELRFNWNTPFLLSVHDSTTLYAGANHVLVSKNNSNALAIISPDLSTRDTAKTNARFRVGGITTDPGRAETWGTVLALAESPRRAGLLFAGTDDGNLWMSQNAGGNWIDLTARVPGVPKFASVSRIEPSHADTATFYVTYDNHMANDFTPYVFVTTDFGRTFTSIVNNLPRGSADHVHVIREDPYNQNLLFVGTDLGVYVSRNRGADWQKFMTGMPTVPVTDLQIHPRERELIAATHGRSVWITGIAPLEQLTPAILAARAHLFAPTPALQYDEKRVLRNFSGNAVYEGTNAPYGAELVYWSNGGAPTDSATIVVTSTKGDTLWRYRGASTRGLHRVTWDYLSGAAAAASDEDADNAVSDDPTRPAEAKGKPVQPIGGSFQAGPVRVPTVASPGEYVVTLLLGGQRMQQPLRVVR